MNETDVVRMMREELKSKDWIQRGWSSGRWADARCYNRGLGKGGCNRGGI